MIPLSLRLFISCPEGSARASSRVKNEIKEVESFPKSTNELGVTFKVKICDGAVSKTRVQSESFFVFSGVQFWMPTILNGGIISTPPISSTAVQPSERTKSIRCPKTSRVISRRFLWKVYVIHVWLIVSITISPEDKNISRISMLFRVVRRQSGVGSSDKYISNVCSSGMRDENLLICVWKMQLHFPVQCVTSGLLRLILTNSILKTNNFRFIKPLIIAKCLEVPVFFLSSLYNDRNCSNLYRLFAGEIKVLWVVY